MWSEKKAQKSMNCNLHPPQKRNATFPSSPKKKSNYNQKDNKNAYTPKNEMQHTKK